MGPMSAVGVCGDNGGDLVVLGFVAAVCVSFLWGANDGLLLSPSTDEL